MSDQPAALTPIQHAQSLIEAEIEQAARIGSVLSRPSEHTSGYMKGLRAALGLVKEVAVTQSTSSTGPG